jgi:hypothetical protein
MAEKNSLIPNMYITQYRLRCRLSQIAFHPSIIFYYYYCQKVLGYFPLGLNGT